MNIGTVHCVLFDSRLSELTDVDLTGYDDEFRTFVKEHTGDAKVYFLKSPERIRVPYDTLTGWFKAYPDETILLAIQFFDSLKRFTL